MTKKLLSLVLIFALILSGCSGKQTETKNGADSNSKTTAASSNQDVINSSSSERVEVKTNFKEIKPGSVPQLSTKQKAEITSTAVPTINELNKILNSIQDAQDIDLNSIN